MSSKIAVTLLGGVNEVGGNIVLLEDFEFDVKILIDFGVNMRKFQELYPRYEHPSSIDELIKLHLIPDDRLLPIENLYLKKDATSEESPSNLDGILISHPHKDHFFGLSFLNRSIPIYTGVVTRKIINAFFKASKPCLENNFKGLNWNTFRTGTVLDIKGMKIVPHHVDHSIPAAYGFIIYTSAGPVVYSGDFRMHGPLSHMTQRFIEQIQSNQLYLSESETESQQELVSNGVKLLICEGTKINKSEGESEKHVKENLDQLFQANPFDYIIVHYDRIDWDRFRTFSHIAKENGWKFIISERDAYFYHIINSGAIYDTLKDPNIINDEHIYILKKGPANYAWQEKIRQDIYKKLQGDRFIELSQIKDLDEHYFIFITFLSNRLLDNLNLDLKGLFISSNIDPYVEEFYDSTNKMSRTLLEYGIPAFRIHASGHATPHDIINFINAVKPQYLIPIHTEHTTVFEKFFQNSEIEVKIAEFNESISLS